MITLDKLTTISITIKMSGVDILTLAEEDARDLFGLLQDHFCKEKKINDRTGFCTWDWNDLSRFWTPSCNRELSYPKIAVNCRNCQKPTKIEDDRICLWRFCSLKGVWGPDCGDSLYERLPDNCPLCNKLTAV